MPVKRLEHVNIRTRNLQAMIEWYGRIMNFSPGHRPAFRFNGAWLYCGEAPVIHLIDDSSAPEAPGNVQLEHFAFSGDALLDFVAHLEQHGIEYWRGVLPGDEFGHALVNFRDFDGNHIHVDFPPHERPADFTPQPMPSAR